MGGQEGSLGGQLGCCCNAGEKGRGSLDSGGTVLLGIM